MGDAITYAIIYNPVSGRGRGERLARAVSDLLSDQELSSSLRATSCSGDAEVIAREIIAARAPADPLCIVACGGDGTMQEIANVVARSDSDQVVMGMAPAGRCNDFARALAVPASPQGIVAVLTGGKVRAVDLGRVGDRYFCTIAALGFDAAVSRFVNDMKMPLRGAPAYVYGTLRVLMRYRAPELKLTGDFEEYVGPVFMVASANTPWYGGAMKIAPDASPWDGQLDLCVVTRTRWWRVLRMLKSVMSGKHLHLPEVRSLRTRRLTVEILSDDVDIEVWADGEPMGRLPLTIESVPAAVRIMLSADLPE